MSNKIFPTIALYFLFLLLLAPIHLLSFDTYYYWDWSRHLALSYYDGSPMIAWMLHISTFLFGDTLFALSFTGITLTALTSYVIYKTARIFLDREASYVAALLWLFSPIVTLNQLHLISYDNPFTLFWALTVYFVIKFIQYHKTTDLHLTGVSIGLMLLSKYSGVVLLLALVVFLLTTSYRSLLKSGHFYLTLLVSLIIFSPVIVWNYQHDWSSFLYQLNTHQLEKTDHSLWNMLQSVFKIFLPTLNVLLLTPVVYWLQAGRKKTQITHFCLVVSAVFICFYLFAASKANLRVGWLQQYTITASLLAGFCYQELNYRRSSRLLIAVYAIISFLLLSGNTTLFNLKGSRNFNEYRWIQQFNALYPQQPDFVVSAGWSESRMLFFLQGKPEIYTLDCDLPENQYALWSAEFAKKVRDKSLTQVLYIDIRDRGDCMRQYFDQCEPLDLPAALDKKGQPVVFSYRCSNVIAA